MSVLVANGLTMEAGHGLGPPPKGSLNHALWALLFSFRVVGCTGGMSGGTELTELWYVVTARMKYPHHPHHPHYPHLNEDAHGIMEGAE
eukprot:CAMPEP_0202920970 /NCGR_PEP_ID=MMETSP1392-20130828/77130_1 /ASSEMBLY_ACC=CAM_ASM_000868 /TAXON_ID=225041 /ORGANISM="Chlamydomonas chlamydogama, Strain SAG 11-48b" /LENGTH=88 /DNA_ID=CAMNT_0049614495 /DNA_START=2677 /DNA_END=2943 /DNA_ORIENTATION=+